MKRFLPICVLITLFCLPGFSAEWKEIYEKAYLDKSSISWKGDTVSFWMKNLNNGDMEPIDGKKVWYAKDYIAIDCDKRKLALKAVVFYDLKHNVLYSHDVQYESLMEWQNIVPETNGDVWYQMFCRAK